MHLSQFLIAFSSILRTLIHSKNELNANSAETIRNKSIYISTLSGARLIKTYKFILNVEMLDSKCLSCLKFSNHLLNQIKQCVKVQPCYNGYSQ